jgi:hypothetical protein
MNEKNTRLLAVMRAIHSSLPDMDVVCSTRTTYFNDGIRIRFIPKDQAEPAITLLYDPNTDFWKVKDFVPGMDNYVHAVLRVNHFFEALSDTQIFGCSANSKKVFDGILEFILSQTCTTPMVKEAS